MSEETVQLHSELSEMRTALFGNALRGDVGLVRNVARMEKVLDDVARDQGEMRAALDEILPMVRQLSVAETRRSEGEQEVRSNWFSELARLGGIILTVILGTTPILVSDVRHRIFGENPLTWLAALLAMIALCAVLAIVTRR